VLAQAPPSRGFSAATKPGAVHLAGFGLDAATTATIRRTLIAIPARLVRSARRWRLRLPEHWPWQRSYNWAIRRILAIPLPT